MSLTFIS